MINFNEYGICDVCGKPMKISESRIEWGYAENVSKLRYLHICHNDCCNDYTKKDIVGGDIIFNQQYTSNPMNVYNHLEELIELYPNFKKNFLRISHIVFKIN